MSRGPGMRSAAMVACSAFWAATLCGLVAAPSAFGNVSCTHNGAGMPVAILVNGNGDQTLRIKVNAGNLAVTDETAGVVAVPCAPDATPALTEVTVINLDDVSFNNGNTTVIVDQGAGRFEPGSGLEATGIAEIELNVGLGTGTSDSLSVLPPSGVSNDTIRAGDADATASEDNEVNVNNDNDSDILTADSTEDFRFNGDTPNSAETGADVVTADGTPGAGQTAYPEPLGGNNLNIFGGGGGDTLASGDVGGLLAGESGDDSLLGGAGADSLRPAAGNDIVNGADGPDTVTYFGSPAGVRVDLAITVQQDTLGGGLDTITDTERLQGSTFGDVLIGNDDDNDFINDGDVPANFGADILYGRFGSDTLSAGNGDDTLIGGPGGDSLTGGGGTDTVSYAEQSTGPVTVDLGTVAAQQTGGAGIDTLQDPFENLTGTPFAGDLITGNALPNFIDIRDGFGDTVTCLAPAAPPDSVRADQATLDSVNADCETVDFLAPVTPVTPVAPGPGPSGPVAGGAKKCKKPKKKAGKSKKKKKCKRKKGKRKT